MLRIPELFIILVTVAVVVWPFWRIFARIGLSGPLAILMFLPLVNVIVIFYVALSKWPIESRAGSTAPGNPPSV